MALALPRTVGVEEDEVAAAVLGLLRLLFLAEKLDHSGTDLWDMEAWVGDARTNGDDDGAHPAGRRRRAWRGVVRASRVSRLLSRTEEGKARLLARRESTRWMESPGPRAWACHGHGVDFLGKKRRRGRERVGGGAGYGERKKNENEEENGGGAAGFWIRYLILWRIPLAVRHRISLFCGAPDKGCATE